MDAQILRSILLSSDVPEEFKSTEEWRAIENGLEFPAIGEMSIELLTKSFTDHLTFKVAPEAYQRYSVRLHLLEVLRNWSQIESNVEHSPILQNGQKAFDFFSSILVRHLKSDKLRDVDDVDKLVDSAKILIKLVIKFPPLMHGFVKLIERLLELSPTENSTSFFRDLLEKTSRLGLNPSLIDKIYCSQCVSLIENPLEKVFKTFLTNPARQLDASELQTLFFHTVASSSLFQLISSKLKDLFMVTNQDQASVDFIQQILEKIKICCEEHDKDIIELYPLESRYCVYLLGIKPEHHSNVSKTFLLDSLREIFIEDHKNAFVLLSQFSDWYPLFTNHLTLLEQN